MRHLPILSEPQGEQCLKYSRQLELYKLGCRVSGGAQPQVMAPVLLAEYGVEERKGGKGGRGGAHPTRLSEPAVNRKCKFSKIIYSLQPR